MALHPVVDVVPELLQVGVGLLVRAHAGRQLHEAAHLLVLPLQGGVRGERLLDAAVETVGGMGAFTESVLDMLNHTFGDDPQRRVRPMSLASPILTGEGYGGLDLARAYTDRALVKTGQFTSTGTDVVFYTASNVASGESGRTCLPVSSVVSAPKGRCPDAWRS